MPRCLCGLDQWKQHPQALDEVSSLLMMNIEHTRVDRRSIDASGRSIDEGQR